jgi:hypothetical protein
MYLVSFINFKNKTLTTILWTLYRCFFVIKLWCLKDSIFLKVVGSS